MGFWIELVVGIIATLAGLYLAYCSILLAGLEKANYVPGASRDLQDYLDPREEHDDMAINLAIIRMADATTDNSKEYVRDATICAVIAIFGLVAIFDAFFKFLPYLH